LNLCCDPTQALQAADKHYVDGEFALAVPLAGGSMTGALATPAVNGVQAPVAGSPQTTLQAAVTAAGTNGAVEIPSTYSGTDTFTNPNGVYVTDLRQGGSQQFERSVKEFGAVCDGITDDTNALQSALNYAQTHGVALTIPQGTCKTRTLTWHGESIGGMGKQVSALMGFPGRDVLETATDSVNLLSYTRIHDLTIYVDQSLDASCSPANGVVPAGSCAANRPMESNSIFSPGGNGLTETAGTGAAWSVGNCAIAMPATTGAGGNGLKVAEIENVEIAATGTDPMAAQYPGAHSTHTCGLYLAQWPQWSEFRNIDIRGLNTGIAIPALPTATPAGLNADSNRWQNITIQATHGFTAAAGSNNVLDNVVASVGNSAATGEPPTGLVLDLTGTQQGWTVRNSVVLPVWNAVQPALTVTAAGGAVSAVTVGLQAGLGFDPYGTQVPLAFSGSCTAQAMASVTSSGSIGTVTVTQGGVGCSGTTTVSVNVTGTWDTSAPVNLIAGQSMTLYGGNLLKGNGGYTVWNAAASGSFGTQFDGGGGNLPGGGTYTALVTNNPVGGAYQTDQFPGADFGAKLQACLGSLNASNGGTCDARNFAGSLSMGSNLTISTANATVLLPCSTISTANQIIVTAGTRNVSLRGCALRGSSAASGSEGGTVFLYSGTKAMLQVGDPTYAADTSGFHLDNAAINTTAATSATAQGLTAYRTQEMYLESLYFLGNSNQTGMTLDGTGNYTGGTFFDDEFTGFQTAVNAIGHQVANAATTDWLNASTFVRLHIDCPTSGGNPISGSYGINLQQGDGNTFTGGDVEGCATAMHLGANAQNNTIVGLRNENSTNQVVADAGSSYNNWMTGGTMYTGQLIDNGTRNSFLDTFHRSFNGVNGDWYGSQKDATVTNHFRIGTGTGNERGLLNEIQTDYGYRWLEGYSDATAGEQFYQVQDMLNNVNRISVGQYNNGQSSTNNQTVINAAGTGAVVLNGSTNSGTGGVVIGSGGVSETTVATINSAGNAQFNGTLQVGGASTFVSTPTVKNQTDAEIDSTLWAGLTASQKESFIYKDWNGNSQWYMVKDQYNNWALNSGTGGIDSFKAYQSTNSGDTYINTSNSSGVVRVNYEPGSGTAFKVYGGSNSIIYASFTGATAIQLPGLAAGSGHSCLQIDNSGYITNTGATCGTGNTNGTVNVGTSLALAYYPGNGTAISPLSPTQAWSSLFSTTGLNSSCAALTTNASGTLTCSSYTPAGALANLGGLPTTGGTMSGPLAFSGSGTAATTLGNLGGAPLTGTGTSGTWPISVAGGAALDVPLAGGTMSGPLLSDLRRNGSNWYDVRSMGAVCNGTLTSGVWSGTDDTAAFQAAIADIYGSTIELPPSISSYCSIQPGLSSGQAALTVQPSQFTIMGQGGYVSRLVDETATNSNTTVFNAPLLQIGTPTTGLMHGTNLKGFQLFGATNVSYPNGMLEMYQNNLSTLNDIVLIMGPGAVNSYGIKNIAPGSQLWGEMRFENVSVYGNNATPTGNTGNTCISLQASSGNTDFIDSNVENCYVGVDFSGSDGTPIMSWVGGHTERIPSAGNINVQGGTAFRIRQAMLQLTGTDVESGMIYLDGSSVNGNIAVGSAGEYYSVPIVDNGVGNQMHVTSGQAYAQQSLNLDGGEQYRTPTMTPDPLFLVSGSAGWTASSSNVTVKTISLTSPGAKAGQGIQIQSQDTTSYAYVTTPALTPNTDYELVMVLYYSPGTTANQVSVYDTQSGTTIYTASVQPTMALPVTFGNDAYRVFRAWIPASSNVTTWQIQVQPSLTVANNPAILTYLGLNPSSTTMSSAYMSVLGSATANCTSATSYSSYLSATCALSGWGSGTANTATATWTLPATAYPTGAFVRMKVTSDANSVVPSCTFGQFKVFFPVNTSAEYNIPLGFWPRQFSCIDQGGSVSDPNDMVISQVSVVPIYQNGVVPVTTPNDGKVVTAVTPDGVQQRSVISQFNGAPVPPSASLLGTNSAGQFVAGPTSPILVSQGGTGAATSSAALTALGAQAVLPGVTSDSNNGIGITGNVSSKTLNGWQRNVCSYSSSTYPTHGDQVRACIADAIAAGGGVCDSRCIEGTTNNTTGILPIEIGSPTAKVIWQLPATGSLTVTQNGTNLPTPSAPGLSGSTTSGTLPAGTYYVEIAYKSGGGHSMASAEASATLSAAGTLTIASPAPTAYSYSYDVYASTASGAETWQANCLIGQPCTIGVAYPGTLVSGYETAPTAANGVPAIIVHSGKGSGIISDASGSGYRLQPNSTMNVSNEIATEDIGSVVLNNLYLGDWSELGTVTDSLVLLQDQFSGSSVNNIWGICLPGAPLLKIRQSNDVTWDNLVFSGGNQAGCSPMMSLDSRHGFGDVADNTDNLTFHNLNLISPGQNATMLQIKGNAYGTAIGGVAANISLETPSFENAYASSNVTMMDVRDTVGLSVANPSFQYLGGTGIAALKLSEDNPCMTQRIRISDARMVAPPGVILVNDTISPETIIPNSTGWVNANPSYLFGSNPNAGCTADTTNYVRNVATNTDMNSAVPYAVSANGPTTIAGTNAVQNPGFEGGGSNGTGTSWTSACQGGGSCTYAINSSIYHSGGHSQSATLATTTGSILLESAPFSVVQGNTYVLSFWARNDGTSGLQLNATVTNTSSTLYCGSQTELLTATWKYFNIPCTALATGSDAEVLFYTATAGGTSGEVWIDDVFFAGTATPINPGFGTAAQLSNTSAVWNANQVNGANVPVSAVMLGTNSSGQLVSATGGVGTVNSVTFTGDGTVLSSTPSGAVTSSGTVTAALANAAQNTVLAGPASGGAGAPSYQAAPAIAVTNMTGTGAFNTTGSAATASALAATPAQCSSGQYSTGVTATGTANCAQVAYSQLSGTPTFTSSTTTFANNSANTDFVLIEPGISGTPESGGLELASATGTPEFLFEEDTSYDLKIHDSGATTPADVFTAYVNGQTSVNSQGTAAVAINNTSTGGTGGLAVYEGGSNYNTLAFSVGAAGYTKVTALAGTGHRCVYADASGGLNVETSDCSSSSGSGTVTSVTFTGDGTVLSSTPTAAVTTSGTVSASLANAAQNSVLAGPASGGTGAPSYQTAPTISAANMTNFPTLNQNTTGTAANLSGTPALPNGTTATTQAAGDNSTKLATTAYDNLAMLSPQWLQYLGNGSGGSNTTASGNMSGEYIYVNFTVPYGNTVTVNSSSGLTIHATGTCTIAGTINAYAGAPSAAYGGSSGGGGGGGTAAGTAASNVYAMLGSSASVAPGGTAGAASGGAGGTGSSASATTWQKIWTNANPTDGLYMTGTSGGQGGSSGGAGGNAGDAVNLTCGAITGTDGTHTGTINVSGQPGTPAATNSTGSGGGGGGGTVILSSQKAVSIWPTIYTAGGPGALATVPQALGVGGTCTTQPKATLGVTSGALNGTCTVVQTGAGCGTGTGLTWSVVGGGGTLGTGTVNPTWSGGALASCTTTAGTSTGYTAATYTTSGTGGDGGAGWYAEFAGW
jgi:hypothetical protein